MKVQELSLHLTTACNLKCSYCYGKRQRTVYLSYKKANAAIEAFIKDWSGSYKKLYIVFTGGEPLLCRELMFKLMERARELKEIIGKDIRFNIMTNGIMLSGPVARLISSFNAFVCFSLDGVRSAHDRSRLFKNGKGSYRSSAASLKRLLKFLGPERFSVRITTLPETVHLLSMGVKEIAAMGVRYVLFAPDYTAAWDRKALKRFEQELEIINRFRSDPAQVSYDFSVEPLETILKRGSMPAFAHSCSERLSLSADGRFFFCHRFAANHSFELGSLSSSYEALIRRKQLSEDLKRALARNKNTLWCPAINTIITGNPETPAPVLKRFAKAWRSFIHHNRNGSDH